MLLAEFLLWGSNDSGMTVPPGEIKWDLLLHLEKDAIMKKTKSDYG